MNFYRTIKIIVEVDFSLDADKKDEWLGIVDRVYTVQIGIARN